MEGLRLLYWYWWCLALILAALEIFLPGAALLWIGAAAGIVGVVAMVTDVSIAVQLLLFGGLAALAWYGSRRLMRRDPPDDQAGTLNRRGEQYVGRTFVLEEGLTDGQGKARVGDSLWQVTGIDNLPVGARVRVIGTDGTILRVQPAEAVVSG